jgi:hypothetical protein
MSLRGAPWRLLGIGAVAFAVLVGGLAWSSHHVRLGGPSTPDIRLPLPQVLVAGGARTAGAALAAETAALLGPSPLFLPTSLSGSQIDLPASSRREPGSAFPAFPAKLVQREDELDLGSGSPLPTATDPVDILTFGVEAGLWPYLGAFPRASTALAKRAVFVEVARAPGGRSLLQVAVDTLPQAPPAGDWRPVEMLVAVDAAGVISEPVLTQASGVAEWDAVLRERVVDQLAFGLKLWPGFYSVRVGP